MSRKPSTVNNGAKPRPGPGSTPAEPPARTFYFPFSFRDWLGDLAMMGLTTQQKGVQIQLLAYSAQSPGCALPDDAGALEAMAGLAPGTWATVGQPVLDRCWRKKGFSWLPVKPFDLVQLMARARAVSEVRAVAGKKGGKATRKSQAITEPEPEPEPELSNSLPIGKQPNSNSTSTSTSESGSVCVSCGQATEHGKSLCADCEADVVGVDDGEHQANAIGNANGNGRGNPSGGLAAALFKNPFGPLGDQG